jgi:hypothetical protein
MTSGRNHDPRDGGGGGGDMHGRDPSEDDRDVAVERALGFLSRPAADPAFRARLRQRFLDVDAPPTAEPRMVPVRKRNNVFPLVWPAVLAASVALVIVFVLSNDNVVRWRVLDAATHASYVVDDHAVDETQEQRMIELLQSAHDIETQDQGLRVQLLDQLVLELGPHTRVSQMRFPPAGAYSLHVDSGSLRVGTGPGFPGGLHITTDDMVTNVTGTIYAVDVEPKKGTCLCCLHGTVMCDAKDKSGAHPVGDDKRGFAYHDGKPAEWTAAFDGHLVPLRDLEAAIQRHGWGK